MEFNIPFYSYISFNTQSLSLYNQQNKTRRRKMIKQIIKLTKQADIVCLQETRINTHDTTILNKHFPKHVILYNNLDNKKGGTVIIIPTRITSKYRVIVHQPPEIAKGRVQHVHLEPLDNHSLPFNIVNVHLASNNKTKIAQLKYITQIPNKAHLFLMGDFNFTDLSEDSPSESIVKMHNF